MSKHCLYNEETDEKLRILSKDYLENVIYSDSDESETEETESEDED